MEKQVNRLIKRINRIESILVVFGFFLAFAMVYLIFK